MNLPDWRDPPAYPDPKTTKDVQWAWEFLRRNSNYQRDWKHELTEYTKNGGDARPAFIRLPDFQIAPGGTKASKGKSYYLKTYGLYSLLNPDQPRPALWPFEPYYGEIRFTSERDKDGQLVTRRLRMTLSPGQAAVLFDLRVGLDKQWEAVEKQLEQLRSEVEPISKRHHRELFPTYLRVLDAKKSRARPATIAELLFPDVTNTYPDFAGNKRVSQSFAAARRYRDSDYRYLAIGWLRDI